MEKEFEEASKKVTIGGIYRHYKNQRSYKVIGFGVQEADDAVCVIYQDEDNKKLMFVRNLLRAKITDLALSS